MLDGSPTTRAHFDPRTRATTIEIQARSHESLEKLAELCDPRAWPRMQRFFHRAVPVQRQGEHWVQMQRPEPIGYSWSGQLREEVRCHVGLIPVQFCNVLDIDYRVSREPTGGVAEIFLGFELLECLHSRIGLSFMRGGLDQDSGFLRVAPSDDAVTLHSVKRVHFTGRRLALLPSAVSEALMNALATRNVATWLQYVVDDGSKPPPKANERVDALRELDRILTRAVSAARGVLRPPR
jgi:hypothetical protein